MKNKKKEETCLCDWKTAQNELDPHQIPKVGEEKQLIYFQHNPERVTANKTKTSSPYSYILNQLNLNIQNSLYNNT